MQKAAGDMGSQAMGRRQVELWPSGGGPARDPSDITDLSVSQGCKGSRNL